MDTLHAEMRWPLARYMRAGSCLVACATAALIVFAPFNLRGDAEADLRQLVARQQAWGPKASSAGATLTLAEGSRSATNGHTTIRYRMNTSGLPKDKIYSLVMWQLGGQPQAVMNGITLDNAGTAVCAGRSDTCHGEKPDDPIDLAMQAGMGETKRVALVATDKSAQVFASVVPFPRIGTDRGCTIEARLVTPNAEAMMLSVKGTKPGAAIETEMNSEGEKQRSSAKTGADGAYEWVALPFKSGLTKGHAEVTARSEGCNPSLSFAWGAGSYALQ